MIDLLLPLLIANDCDITNKVFRSSNTKLSTRYEIIDDEDQFLLTIDVPGFKEYDLKVTTDNSNIYVSGNSGATKNGREEDTEASRHKNFIVNSKTTDLSKVKANLSDGVLIITAPKIPKPLPVSIIN